MSNFSIALSGLSAASTALDITSNNIANADTIGFKDSQAEFADVYASGAVNLDSSEGGEGVRVVTAAQLDELGRLVAGAVMGKPGGGEGDTLAEIPCRSVPCGEE